MKKRQYYSEFKLKFSSLSRPEIAFLVLVAAGLLLAVIWAFLSVTGDEKTLKEVTRSDYGGASQTFSAVLRSEFQGKTLEKDVTVIVEPRSLSEEEKQAEFDDLRSRLMKTVLGKNSSADSVCYDLNLISYDEDTGIEISWESSNIELIDTEGNVYPSEEEDGEYVQLKALMSLDGSEEEWKCNIRHTARLSEENFEKDFEREVESLLAEINSDKTKELVALPDKTEKGQTVVWKEKPDSTLLILSVLAIILAFGMRCMKKSNEKKIRELRKEEIEREFPYFLDKLVMLLSAGLILKEAVVRISDDYQNNVDSNHRKVLYEELGLTVMTMKETNSALSTELIKLSGRLGVREFARLAVILRDSLESGMELSVKLSQESELMWTERRASVQKLGRTADTRLVFPLVIILIVLIIIVMAPAVMQM